MVRKRITGGKDVEDPDEEEGKKTQGKKKGNKKDFVCLATFHPCVSFFFKKRQ